jgi:tripeptidyl-peptidase-1
MYNTPEIAATASGGGFSNYFRVPAYQSSAVPAYLAKLGVQNSGLFKYVRCLDLI